MKSYALPFLLIEKENPNSSTKLSKGKDMYSILCGVALGLVIGYGLYLAEKKFLKGRQRESIWLPGALACGVSFGVLNAVFFASGLNGNLPMLQIKRPSLELVSMRNDESRAVFIVGREVSQLDRTYSFMMKQADGSMVPGSLPISELVHISEDAALTNSGTWTTIYQAADPASPLYYWAAFKGSQTRIIRHDFRVPVGTLVRDFRIQ